MLKLMHSVFCLLVVMIMLLIKINASRGSKTDSRWADGSKILFEQRNVKNGRGVISDRRSLVVKNTEAFWEEYWRQYAENILENPPDGNRRGKREDGYSSYSSGGGCEDSSFQFIAALLPGLAALLGVFALASINARDQINQQNEINELNRHQDTLCTAARALGETQLALTTAAQVPGVTAGDPNQDVADRFNLIENAINAITTPDCNN